MQEVGATSEIGAKEKMLDAQIKVGEVNAKLDDSDRERSHRERLLMAEAAATPPTTKGGGGTL